MRTFFTSTFFALAVFGFVFFAAPQQVHAQTPEKTYCCCIKGGNCLEKKEVGGKQACAFSDFGSAAAMAPGLQYFVTSTNSGGSCNPAPVNYCLCSEDPSKVCHSNTSVSVGGKLERFVCDPASLGDPHICESFCQKNNQKMLYCGEDAKQGSIDNLKSISNGGCSPNHCWCKNSGGFCEHVAYNPTAKDGGSFLDEDSCTNYCLSKNRGTGATAWSKLAFQIKFEDLYRKDPASGGCNYKVAPPKLETRNFTNFLRSDAAQLNVLGSRGPAEFIGNGIRIILMFIGSIVLVMYIYGGFLWMVAAGNAEQITKAKQILVWSSLGVVAMLASYVVVKFLFGTVLQLPI